MSVFKVYKSKSMFNLLCTTSSTLTTLDYHAPDTERSMPQHHAPDTERSMPQHHAPDKKLTRQKSFSLNDIPERISFTGTMAFLTATVDQLRDLTRDDADTLQDCAPETVSFAGTTSFLHELAHDKTRDIALLKDLMRYYLQTEHEFWYRDHELFLQSLWWQKAAAQKSGALHEKAGHRKNKRRDKKAGHHKRVSVQQTSLNYFGVSSSTDRSFFKDNSVPQGATVSRSHETAQDGPFCENCAKLQGRGKVKALIMLFNKIARQKRDNKHFKREHCEKGARRNMPRSRTTSLRQKNAHKVVKKKKKKKSALRFRPLDKSFFSSNVSATK